MVKQKKSILRGYSAFFALVFIPVFIASFYYLLIASDIYISESEFSVYKTQDPSPLGDLGSLGLNINTDNKDLFLVKEFIKSKEMLFKLQKEIDIKSMYSINNVDLISRLKENVHNNDFHIYFSKMVDISVYRDASLLTLRTRAFTPEDAYKVNSKIIEFTQEFINNLSKKIKDESLNESKEILEDVEQSMIDIKREISQFRQDNRLFDPLIELQSRMEFIKALQATKAQIIANRSEMNGGLKSNSFEIKSKNKSLATIEREIEKEKKALLENDKKGGKAKEEYELLKLKEEFSLKKYELALYSLEETYRNSQKKGKHIVLVVRPTMPDFAVEPERLFGIITAFFLSFLIVSILGLIISSIKDHMI